MNHEDGSRRNKGFPIAEENQDLFGSMRGTTIPECEEEFDEVFGETNTERNDKILSYELLFIFLFFL